MGSENRFDGIDAYAAMLIRYKARQLVRRADFAEVDQEDLEQEMVMDLLHRLPQYDSTRAQRNTFMARIIEHKVASLLSFRRAAKRDSWREECSLNEDVPAEEGGTVERVQMLDQDEYLRRIGAAPRPAAERRDLRLAVEEALRRLPEDLQRLCGLLSTHSVAGASRATGIPRATIYDALKKIRAEFERAGLSEDF